MRGSPVERFEAKFTPEPNTGCWLWTAATVPEGYGHFAGDGRTMRGAHRFAYELFVGPIPEGMQLDHLCRTRSCVNPAHLEPVTSAENTRRGMRAVGDPRLAPHCQYGHAFDEANTYLHGGSRKCRACRARRDAVRSVRIRNVLISECEEGRCQTCGATSGNRHLVSCIFSQAVAA